MWGVTCIDTFAPSYATMVSNGPGCIANWDEYLVPIGIATTGVFRTEANYFLSTN